MNPLFCSFLSCVHSAGRAARADLAPVDGLEHRPVRGGLGVVAVLAAWALWCWLQCPVGRQPSCSEAVRKPQAAGRYSGFAGRYVFGLAGAVRSGAGRPGLGGFVRCILECWCALSG